VEDNVRRSQHLSGAFAALLTLLPLWASAQTANPTPDTVAAPDKIVALVELTPQLRIDKTIFSAAFDAKTHPYVNVRNAPEGTIGGYLVPEGSHRGLLSDGTYVLAVPLDSEGSGGVFTQIIFAGHDSNVLGYVGYIDSGGHLDVQIENGVIVADLPYYGDDSPNCCPRERTVQTYTVRGGALVKLSEKRAPIPKGE
jgi:hypothetical protein